MSWITVRSGHKVEQLDFPYGKVLLADDGSQFQLDTAVRQGGNGVVFTAKQLAPDGRMVRKCAVKLLKQLEPVRQDRFANEIVVLRALNHSRITRVYGSGRVALGTQQIDIPWVAMDLGGANFREEVEKNGPLKLEVVIDVGIEACNALLHFHKLGYIHRDIKPQNFVWIPTPGSPDFFLIDFGIAKRVSEDVRARPLDQFTQQSEFVGPVHFASPELIEYARNKDHPVDARSDLFQLGLVLWFLATNQIVAGIPSKRRDPSGGPLLAFVNGLLAAEPQDRPGSAAEVQQQLISLGRDLGLRE